MLQNTSTEDKQKYFCKAKTAKNIFLSAIIATVSRKKNHTFETFVINAQFARMLISVHLA